MSTEHPRETSTFIPVERETIMFYGHPIVAVRLPDSRIAVMLRWLCEGMGLNAQAQVRRIQRTEAIANELVTVRMETEFGMQELPALMLEVLPGWLMGLDTRRVKDDIHDTILAYQREAYAVLYRHFAERAARLTSPPVSVPTETPKPTEPPHDASNAAWATYHEQMAEWYRWRDDIEVWRTQAELRLRDHEQQLGELQARVEGDEEVARMLIEMMQRQPPQSLAQEHQATVKAMVKRLHDLAGFGFGAIYGDLNEAFHVGKFSDIPDVRWEEVTAWLTVRIKAAEKRGR